ncbi:MAG: lysophospholipid acyltransferase family protein [Polaribacter sp.]|uniref:lysophospholipid acyltransferase family protein n=1 Tax=Polaribacter sp. TaxID=1920175 RepID=UPI003BAFEDF9
MKYLHLEILYACLWMLSKLPMRLLYIVSDFFFLVIYYVLGYRKKVVVQNISYVFPNKTAQEKEKITKAFYHHLTDLIVESLKGFSISKEEILKRYTYKNPEVIDNYIQQGKSIALMGSHLGNWEWIINLPLVLNIKVYGSYSKLKNDFFEKKMKQNREKFGFIGVKTSDTVKKMLQNKKNNIQSLYILLSDQSPMVEKTLYWSHFFGVQLPIHTGAESISKKFDFVVINSVVRKIKRGYYETEYEVITDEPNSFNDYEITEKYLKRTEEFIRNQPEIYLWSHNRFKHQHRFEEWTNMNIAKKKTKS